MKILAKYLGGSMSYGLATPQSDKDERYVFIHTDYSKILGLSRHDYECRQTDTTDSFGWEIRHFLNLLRNGNTMCLEMIYNNTWLEITDEWKYVQSFRNKLIDSHKLYKCLKGYAHSELKLANGIKTGRLGSKRQKSIQNYGFSEKNFVQLFRLLWAGKIFFETGSFPVCIKQYSQGFSDLLLNIKLYPKNFTIKYLNEQYEILFKELEVSYLNTKIDFKFDADIANNILLTLYKPYL